jgi:hypothetical protein
MDSKLTFLSDKPSSSDIPLVPQGQLLHSDGEPVGIPGAEVDLGKGIGIHWNFQDSRNHELIARLLEIPLQVRSLAGKFAQFQWLILEGTIHTRGFREFVEQEMNSENYTYLHTCFLFADAECLKFNARLKLFESILSMKRGELLTVLIEQPCSNAFIKILSWLRESAPSKEAILKLKALADSPAKSKVLPILKQDLTLSFLDVVKEIPAWLCTSKIMKILHESQTSWRRSDIIFPPSILEAESKYHKSIRDSMHSCKSLGELEQKIITWADKLFFEQPFPKPPIPGNHLLVPIRSSKELQAEGKEMNHCVAGYASEVATGHSYFFRWLGSERATVQLSLIDGLWSVYEHLGHSNKQLSSKTIREIHQTCASQMIKGRMLYNKVKIAGIPFYDGSLFEKQFSSSHPQELILRVEPGNEYDCYAVEVVSSDGLKLGYIPKTENRILYDLLQKGVKLRASVLKCKYIGNYLKIIVEVYLEGEGALY